MSGQPLTFNQAIARSVQGNFCAILAVEDGLQQLLRRVVPNPARRFTAAGELRRLVCNADPEGDAVFVPPFTGAQCDCLGYAFQWQTFNPQTGRVDNPSPQIIRRGPLGRLELEFTPTPGNPQSGRYRLFQTNRGTAQQPCVPVRREQLSQFDFSAGLQVRYFFVGTNPNEPPGGCGNIGPTDPPPVPITFAPTTITYTTVEGDEITNNLTGVFSPIFVNVRGEFAVDFNIDVGGFTFNGTLNLNPQLDFSLRPGTPIDEPGVADDDQLPPAAPAPPPAPGLEEEPQNIKAVFVVSTVQPGARATRLRFTGGPDIFAPRLGSVKFGIRLPRSGRIAWTPDIDVKNAQCFITCPWPGGAVAVRVSPAPNVSMQSTAIRADFRGNFG